MDELGSLLEIINRAGVLGLLIGGAVALWKRVIVLGWVYEQCVAENQSNRQLLSANAARVEAKLERLEDEERARRSRERP